MVHNPGAMVMLRNEEVREKQEMVIYFWRVELRKSLLVFLTLLSLLLYMYRSYISVL